MTYESINEQLQNISFSKVIEVGPGPGTFTKLLLFLNNKASFVLVDISKEMMVQAKINLGERKNIMFIVQDFSTFDLKKECDLFFASRVIEYVPAKKKFLDKAFKVLKKGGHGIIITKNPNSLGRKISRIIGKKVSLLHTNQIAVLDLTRLLKEAGFIHIETYPVVVCLPSFLHTHCINRLLWRLLHKKRSGFFSTLFSESYLVRFKK